jgi:hypothetical protein
MIQRVPYATWTTQNFLACSGDKMKDYPETHLYGVLSIENDAPTKPFRGDLGIRIASDGRIWICLDGIAFLRFKPLPREEKQNGTGD